LAFVVIETMSAEAMKTMRFLRDQNHF